MKLCDKLSASLQARLVQPWVRDHFEATKAGKELRQYRQAYSGQRCFLIGNGPSLRAEDLTRLQQEKAVTFAFNRIYNIFDQTDWRPTFYISQDEKMLAGCADQVAAQEMPVKLIPLQLRWYHGIAIPDAAYFNLAPQKSEDPEAFAFSDRIDHVVFNSSTVMYTAAQFAAYMGFAELYLLGVDHHFQISRNNRGEIVVDPTAKDYFSERYNQDKDRLYIPNTEKSTLTYLAMKKHCEARHIRVFNATRGGKLDVFPRVDFDTLFSAQGSL